MNQQIKYRNRYNSPKGITIVALAVTIVIMLITLEPRTKKILAH